MVASHSPGADADADTTTESTREPMTDATDAGVADALMAAMTAEELRRFAAHSGASRKRGANKRDTAEQVVDGDRDLAALAAEAGMCTVKCGCGLSFSVAHPQTARREAKSHKSQHPTHWPKARDETHDPETIKLYG